MVAVIIIFSSYRPNPAHVDRDRQRQRHIANRGDIGATLAAAAKLRVMVLNLGDLNVYVESVGAALGLG
jgi:hypothetical protein